VGDQFRSEQKYDGQGELCEPVNGLAIGVSAELTVRGKPGVGAFHRPAHSHWLGVLALGVALLSLLGDDGVIE
jgi:hypothetical protein